MISGAKGQKVERDSLSPAAFQPFNRSIFHLSSARPMYQSVCNP